MYVDDLCLSVKDPLKLLNQLQLAPFNFKLKGYQPIKGAVHLGCKFVQDQHGVIYMGPNQYITHMEDAYYHQFKDKPNTKVKYPLDPDDHPELDMSPFLDEYDTQIYQTLIGAIQWAITIGKWGINTTVMTLSSFRSQPCIGHLMRVKRIYGYLIKFCNFVLMSPTMMM